MSGQTIQSDATYNLIKQGLKASNLRGKTIANNMANINTKDYKKFNVVFEENLKKSSDSTFKMKTTNDDHYTDSSSDLKRTSSAHFASSSNNYGENISIVQDKGTSMRTDGNNVDLEAEKVNQAANTLKYNALITNINTKFNNLKTVIK